VRGNGLESSRAERRRDLVDVFNGRDLRKLIPSASNPLSKVQPRYRDRRGEEL
jgi:hypothetical protein